MPGAGRVFSFAGRNGKGRATRISSWIPYSEYENCRPGCDGDRRDGGDQGASRNARSDRTARTGTSRARLSAFRGKIVADPCVLRRAESGGGNRALPPAARVRRAGAHLRDPLAESLGDSGIRRSHARVSRGGEQRVGARLDRLFDEPLSRDDFGLRRARGEHHFGQYWSAALDERETDCLGIARRRAPHSSRGSAHDGSSERVRAGGSPREGDRTGGSGNRATSSDNRRGIFAPT